VLFLVENVVTLIVVTFINGACMIESNQSSDPWSYIQDWDVEYFGPEIRDPEQRRRWETTFAIAGGLPYMWRTVARPISHMIYGLLEARASDKILIIGEGVAPAGWADDLRKSVGATGTIDVVEIIRDGRNAVMEKKRGRNGKLGCWQWLYANGVSDNTYDAIGILQSTQHCDDWCETGAELVRVLKPGGRIVFAEAVLGGASFMQRISADVHVMQWYAKMFPAHVNFDEVSNYSGQDLMSMCGPLLDDPQHMEWRGIEMFWGRKHGIRTGRAT
jgi:SAM-dependent methyltransferase